MQVTSIVGARPNFVKLAALDAAFGCFPEIDHQIVHTGQHYDFELSQLFFQELHIPEPTHYLGIGSGTHAEQVGKAMMALEGLLSANHPDWVLAIGDVNATLSTALVTKKMGLRLAHVEAGLRSFDWTMPEEINRMVTDRLSDLLFVSEPSGVDNLLREGTPESRIRFVGNVMIDTLKANFDLVGRRTILADLGLHPRQYGVITLHRPSNTDEPEKLRAWMNVFEQLSTDYFPFVFPVHPRTRERLSLLRFTPTNSDRLLLIEPVGYLDMLALQKNARLIMTDSGGIQEETTTLGIPCLTLRDNTERPVTISDGTNRLVGSNPQNLLEAVNAALNTPVTEHLPPYWDGNAAQRIASYLVNNPKLPLRRR